MTASFPTTPSSGGSPAADGPRARPSPAEPSRLAQSQASSSLRSRRDELAEQVAELHWDLGGLAYEMAIRDHFRLDVLVRRAALLQERDAELAEIERLLRLEESASAGACPTCGAPHSRGALFCWQCGGALMERAQSTAVPAASAEEGGGAEAPAAADRDPASQDTLVIDSNQGSSAPALSADQRDTLVIGSASGSQSPSQHGRIADGAAALGE